MVHGRDKREGRQNVNVKPCLLEWTVSFAEKMHLSVGREIGRVKFNCHSTTMSTAAGATDEERAPLLQRAVHDDHDDHDGSQQENIDRRSLKLVLQHPKLLTTLEQVSRRRFWLMWNLNMDHSVTLTRRRSCC